MQERKLKVRTEYREEGMHERSCTGFRKIPKIILQGDWLKKAGFNEEDRITVRCGKGRLTIRKQYEKE